MRKSISIIAAVLAATSAFAAGDNPDKSPAMRKDPPPAPVPVVQPVSTPGTPTQMPGYTSPNGVDYHDDGTNTPHVPKADDKDKPKCDHPPCADPCPDGSGDFCPPGGTPQSRVTVRREKPVPQVETYSEPKPKRSVRGRLNVHNADE